MLNERAMPNPRRKWRFRYLPAFRNQSLYPYPESGCLSSLRCFTLRKHPWGCWTVLRNSPVTGRALRTCSPASSAPGDADSCSSHGSTSWASTVTSAWRPPPLLALFQGVVAVPAALEELLPAPGVLTERERREDGCTGGRGRVARALCNDHLGALWRCASQDTQDVEWKCLSFELLSGLGSGWERGFKTNGCRLKCFTSAKPRLSTSVSFWLQARICISADFCFCEGHICVTQHSSYLSS